MKINSVTFYGRPVEEMTRPQLLKLVEFLTEEYAAAVNERNGHQKEKIGYMKELAKRSKS